MGRLTPFFGVLGLLGFAVLHACSSDEGGTPGKKKGGGGSGGTGGEAGAPGTGGSSGSAGDRGGGGTAGSSTGGSGGAAGQAGEPSGGTPGESGAGGQGGEGATGPGDVCTMCIGGGAVDSPRAVLLDNCADSPSCAAWMSCMRGCSDAACLDACESSNPGVNPYRYAIYSALCDACETECSTLDFCDRTCVDDLDLGVMMTAPATLAETGLYNSGAAGPDQVANYVRAFQPEYELWSDGAQKRRWAYLPACSRIGTEGINHWIFPVGTRFWKEFTAVSSTSVSQMVRVETRLLHKYGPLDTDWLFATYRWPVNDPTPTAAEATLVDVAGVPNANGTNHDIPGVAACQQCHTPLVERVLGFGAIQLSHNLAGVNIRELADAGWLTFPAASTALGGGLARNGFDPPGNEVEQRALGYLHANCGNCHHEFATLGGTTPARMRVTVGQTTVAATNAYTSLVNVPTLRPAFMGCDRIEPGSPSLSEIIMRMNRRDAVLPGQQMPPLASEQVHAQGVTVVSAWIGTMTASGPPPTTCTPPP
jgi:hypothetical protein